MMRRVEQKGLWVHPLCVLYTPELTLDVNRSMLPNDISVLDRDRDGLLCEVCGKRGGSNIQCSYESCLTSYHPYCGFMANKMMIIRCVEEESRESEGEGEESEERDYLYHYEVYCDKHRHKIPRRESVVSSTVPLVESHSLEENFQSPPPSRRPSTREDDNWIQESHEKKSMKRRR
jgi:hypothetical protein